MSGKTIRSVLFSFVFTCPKRMPDIVEDWTFGKNVSLADRTDKNRGMNWICLVYLKDEAALAKYIPHPEHVLVKKLQGPLVDDIVPLDFHVPPTSALSPYRLVGYAAALAVGFSLGAAVALNFARR